MNPRTDSIVDLAIVGGGAAGMATAIFAARKNPQRSIVVLDGAKKLGAKILVSGGGRCNVTNDVVTADDFNGGSSRIVARILNAFPAEQAVAFFKELGVSLHVEAHGKLFPDTNRAQTVLDALLAELGRLHVSILTDHRVTAVERRNDGFELTTSGGFIASRRLVLATGGLSLPKTGSDGGGYELARQLDHFILPTTPALVPLILDGDFHAPLSGIAQDVELTVLVESEKPTRLHGAMLWTHFGVSGPVVMDASRHWTRTRLENRSARLSVNFIPGETLETAESKLLALSAARPTTWVHNAIETFGLPARVAAALVNHAKIDERTALAHLTRDDRRRLLHSLLDWPLPVRDSRGYNFAEVTAGGVPLNEIVPATMASRRCPGLYLVGEILDVDGRIGGFNFQWAWSSAWVVAQGMFDGNVVAVIPGIE